MADNQNSVYERLGTSSFNNAVGGGNPLDVAQAQAAILMSLEPVSSAHRVLDYGCGIGRTMPILASKLGTVQLDGCDISEDFIRECRTIHSSANFRFFCIQGSNDHYRQYNIGQGRETIPQEFYDFTYSFSVFTHLDIQGAHAVLAAVNQYLRTGGHYYFTCFRIDQESTAVINENRSPTFKFQNRVNEKASEFFASNNDPFAFTALSKERLEAIIFNEGFELVSYYDGSWRGRPAANLHDAYLIKKANSKAAP